MLKTCKSYMDILKIPTFKPLRAQQGNTGSQKNMVSDHVFNMFNATGLGLNHITHVTTLFLWQKRLPVYVLVIT